MDFQAGGIDQPNKQLTKNEYHLRRCARRATTPSTPHDGSASRGFPRGSAGSTTEAEARRATPEQKGMLVDEEGYRGRLKIKRT